MTKTAEKTFAQAVIDKVRSKGLKYSMVSVVNVFVGQGLLIFFHAAMGMGPTLSNVFAVCISAVPAFYLSRAWVWEKHGRIGKVELRREVFPFWIFIMIGLGFSTLVVNLASKVSTNALVPNLANMTAFGILWVIRFFLMDVMFRHHPHITITEVTAQYDGLPDDRLPDDRLPDDG